MTRCKQRFLWQPLMRMVIEKICKMTVKGVKSKSESLLLISHGVLELWRKNLKGADVKLSVQNNDDAKLASDLFSVLNSCEICHR